MKKVNILGTLCTLRFAYYNNNTVAIEANANGELFAFLTVNWEANWEGLTKYSKTFKFPAVVIKNYSENEGVVKNLVDAGVVTAGPYMANTQGGVEVCFLTDEWQEIARKQLEELLMKTTNEITRKVMLDDKFKMPKDNFIDRETEDPLTGYWIVSVSEIRENGVFLKHENGKLAGYIPF